MEAPAPHPSELLTRIEARDFRNLVPTVWGPAAGSHLLLGGNGAGKTSLLEAIYAVATTRSFRAGQLSECVSHGASAFELRAEVETGRRVLLEVSWGPEGKLRLVNGKPAPLAEHLAVLPIAAWTAAEAEVLTGAPQARRRFMDRGVVGLRPPALEALGRYREALRQKRELLASDEPGGLEIWNELLAAAAAEVIRLRHSYVELLRGALAQTLAEASLPLPPIALSYRPSPPDGLAGAEAIARGLARLAESERRRQQPLLGPHRDELEIRWGEHEVRRVASGGERKALSLLLLAAHGRVAEEAGRQMVYLLDDVDAELAPPTLAALWRVFQGERQLIASSNRPQVWLALEVGTIWEMEKGRATRLS